MGGEVRTRRWNDPAAADDGFRLLVTRYRPRGVRKADEPWDAWWPDLGPTPALHAAAYGKGQPAIDWPTYRARFLAEVADGNAPLLLRGLAERVAAGETLTLLCSSACVDPERCHRSILRRLLLGG